MTLSTSSWGRPIHPWWIIAEIRSRSTDSSATSTARAINISTAIFWPIDSPAAAFGHFALLTNDLALRPSVPTDHNSRFVSDSEKSTGLELHTKLVGHLMKNRKGEREIDNARVLADSAMAVEGGDEKRDWAGTHDGRDRY